jgi:hypothetical protein
VNAGRVQVVCVEVPNFGAAKQLQELMAKTVKGAKVEERGVKDKIATYDVDVDGGSEALAAAIDGKKVGRFTIEVKEQSRGKLVLKLNG